MLAASSGSWLPGSKYTGTGTSRSSSSERLTTRGLTRLDSNTSPQTSTASQRSLTAIAPIRRTAWIRASVYRGWASASRKCRVMPSCQSAVCSNRTGAPSSGVDRRSYRPGGHPRFDVGQHRVAARERAESAPESAADEPVALGRHLTQQTPLGGRRVVRDARPQLPVAQEGQLGRGALEARHRASPGGAPDRL